jgi:hypothetical protein
MSAYGFQFSSCLFVKENQNEVSAGFYEIVKFLPVTLFRELVPAF